MAAVGLSVLGSLGGLLAAAAFLLLGDSLRTRIVPWAISYAVGTLLGVALLALLPEALGSLPPHVAMATLLAGVLTFFLLEKLVLWRHCHDGDGHECEAHTSSAASLVIIGDAFHTFVDGAIIAAAVLTSIPLGVTTALAVAAHEIPQEVGDVAILLRAGYSRSRALTLNMVSALGGVLGRPGDVDHIADTPPAAPLCAGLCGGQFSLHRNGRPDPGSASRQRRGWRLQADGVDQRWHPDDRAPVARPSPVGHPRHPRVTAAPASLSTLPRIALCAWHPLCAHGE